MLIYNLCMRKLESSVFDLVVTFNAKEKLNYVTKYVTECLYFVTKHITYQS